LFNLLSGFASVRFLARNHPYLAFRYTRGTAVLGDGIPRIPIAKDSTHVIGVEPRFTVDIGESTHYGVIELEDGWCHGCYPQS
jgi:hypothetical protein